LRWPFSKRTRSTPRSSTNRRIAATNARVIGSIKAPEANWHPRALKNPTTPRSHCNCGTYRFRYIRSMHSTSRVTCSDNPELYPEVVDARSGEGGGVPSRSPNNKSPVAAGGEEYA
jgi:hypothetical protein